MSASLVGSEMCIRDRAPPRDPLGGHRTVANEPLQPPKGRWGRASVATVSYTHLTLPTICSV
eukprot:7678849-Alexandrium_andersonii.AAC.1